MRWLLLILVIIAALLCLDFSNALWKTREARRDLKNFLVVKEGVIKDIYPVEQACSNKRLPCTRIAIDISYEYGQKKHNQSTVYLASSKNSQIGQPITLLCDSVQNMCLPRTFVHQLRSIWLATHFSKIFS